MSSQANCLFWWESSTWVRGKQWVWGKHWVWDILVWVRLWGLLYKLVAKHGTGEMTGCGVCKNLYLEKGDLCHTAGVLVDSRCFFSIHISSYATNSRLYEQIVCLKIMIWPQVARGLLCSGLSLLVTWTLSLKKSTSHFDRLWERSIPFSSAVLSPWWRKVQFWKALLKKDRGKIWQ